MLFVLCDNIFSFLFLFVDVSLPVENRSSSSSSLSSFAIFLLLTLGAAGLTFGFEGRNFSSSSRFFLSRSLRISSTLCLFSSDNPLIRGAPEYDEEDREGSGDARLGATTRLTVVTLMPPGIFRMIGGAIGLL